MTGPLIEVPGSCFSPTKPFGGAGVCGGGSVPDVVSLFTALSNFGALGVLVAFLIWRDHCATRDKLAMEKEHAGKLMLLEERKLNMDRERLNADKELTAVLATLTATIQARWND